MLKLPWQQAMPQAEPVRPASVLQVVVWGQPLRSGQPVSVRLARRPSLLVAVSVLQVLGVQVWQRV